MLTEEEKEQIRALIEDLIKKEKDEVREKKAKEEREKEEELQRLRNGDFSDGVRIDEWFGCQEYRYIKAALRGCDKTVDHEKFSFILMYALRYMEHPNGNVWKRDSLERVIKASHEYPDMERMSDDELVAYWNGRITEECEEVVRIATIVGSHHYDVYGPILERLYTNKNDAVRLYCAANLNYLAFVNDPNERVAKVANIRKDFEYNFAFASENERKIIEFLVSAVDNDVIQCMDGCVGGYPVDRMMALFQSHLFTRTEWISGFDIDVMRNIGDKRVLAAAIYELIKEGRIALDMEMLPPIFSLEAVKVKTKNENERKG